MAFIAILWSALLDVNDISSFKSAIKSSKTSEYGVEHPRWDVYPLKNYQIDVDFGNIYGTDFSFLQNAMPKSVFLAEGSMIKVKAGRTL